MLLFDPGTGTRHPRDILGQRLNEPARTDITQLVLPSALACRFCHLIANCHKTTICRQCDIAHPLAVEQIVYHVRMATVGNRVYWQLRVKSDADAVGILWLSKITDGKGMVLRSQTKFRTSLFTIDIEFVVLGAADVDLAFHVACVVDEKAEHTNRLRISHRRQESTFEGRRWRCRQLYGRHHGCVIETFAVHVDGIGCCWCTYRERSCLQEFCYCGLYLCRCL